MTHQKTDKTGPKTHQRTVVPERDNKQQVSVLTGGITRVHKGSSWAE